MIGFSKKNIKPMIGSFVVAVILWLMVATENNYDYQVSVPIELVRLAPGRTLYEPIPDDARVEIRGKGRSLMVLWFYDLGFRLDFPDMHRSQTIMLEQYLNTFDIPGALNIEIIGVIEPKTIELKIDELVEEARPVALNGNIQIEDGYTLINYRFQPDSVTLTGPKQLVRKVTEILTDRLDLNTRKISFSENLNLLNPHPGLTELRTESVEAAFNVQRLVERVIYDIPIHVKNVPRNFNVEPVPQKMALRIKGGEQIIADIGSDEILAEINFAKQYRVDREEYAAEIVTPESVNWIESIPKKFKLKIKRR